jgi:hypothetical protein
MKNNDADLFQPENMMYPIMSREAMLIPHPEATVNAAEGWSNLPSL